MCVCVCVCERERERERGGRERGERERGAKERENKVLVRVKTNSGTQNRSTSTSPLRTLQSSGRGVREGRTPVCAETNQTVHVFCRTY